MPVFHQGAQARVGAFGEDDFGGDIEIAAVAVAVWQALAFKAHGFARAHARRHFDLHFAFQSWHADFCPQHRFIEGQWQLKADIEILDLEQLVGQNLDGDQSASPAGPVLLS